MKKRNKIQVRPTRLAGYLVLFLADIFLYLFFRSYLFLAVTVLFILWPAVSALGLWYLAGEIQGSMGAGQERVRCGDRVFLTLRLQNNSWWLSLDAGWQLCIENTLWGEQSGTILSMPVKLHGKETVTLPLYFTGLGHFRISCESLIVQDIMGLARIHIPFSGACEINVLPEEGGYEQEKISGYLSGASETEESREKGNDFAEVSDIREYIPGDRFRDIHWKLSAKKDILMIKERVAVAGSEMAIVLEFSTERELTEQVLERGYHLSKEILEQQMPVCFLLWNQRTYGWEEYRCGSPDEIDAAFCGFYQTAAALRFNTEWELYLKNCYPYLTDYLLVGVKDGEVQVVMSENV